MSVPFPLSGKQHMVWGMLRRGLWPAEILDRLQASPRHVRQVAQVAKATVAKTLLGVAETAYLQVKQMNASNGILWAVDLARRANVVITHTNRHGVRLWHWYDRPEEAHDQAFWDEVRTYLVDEAVEHGLKLALRRHASIPPSWRRSSSAAGCRGLMP